MTAPSSVEAGDLIAYEYAESEQWYWCLARVLSLPHPRLMTIEPWEPAKRLDMVVEEKQQANAMMEQIARQQKTLGEERANAIRLASELSIKSAEIAERYASCETELGDVLPTLEEAKRAVSGISMKDLREIKAYVQPPVVVKLVMEAVLTVLGEGKKASDWDWVKTAIVDVGFVPRVKYFDAIEMSSDTVQRVARTCQHPDFTFDRAARASKAAGPLQKWVVAQLAYINAIPSHLRPLLEQARLLKDEMRRLEESNLRNDLKIKQCEGDLRRLHEKHNALLYGEGAVVSYDVDGNLRVTRSTPSGTWVPADSKKLTLVRSCLLLVVDKPGPVSVANFTFDKATSEALRMAANISGAKDVIPKKAKSVVQAATATTKSVDKWRRTATKDRRNTLKADESSPAAKGPSSTSLPALPSLSPGKRSSQPATARL